MQTCTYRLVLVYFPIESDTRYWMLAFVLPPLLNTKTVSTTKSPAAEFSPPLCLSFVIKYHLSLYCPNWPLFFTPWPCLNMQHFCSACSLPIGHVQAVLAHIKEPVLHTAHPSALPLSSPLPLLGTPPAAYWWACLALACVLWWLRNRREGCAVSQPVVSQSCSHVS